MNMQMRRQIGEAIACMTNAEMIPGRVYANFSAFGTLVSNKSTKRGRGKKAEREMTSSEGERVAA